MPETFTQPPPTLSNEYTADRVLQSYLRRVCPPDVLRAIEPELKRLGALAGGELYDLQQSDLDREPTLTRWGPWGERVDRIEVTDVWTRAAEVAAEFGVVAAGYDDRFGALDRVRQFALAYLFIPSTDMYGCPLAMTDGAAFTLLQSGNDALVDAAVPHLTTRDPDAMWTAGQWMTELAGGSDVGRSRTTARRSGDGTWRLTGRKWFTSAITANCALALARPEGNPSGGRGLALYYVPIRDGNGLRDGIRVNRLKDKLGTRKLPTAELDLDGAVAHLVTEEPMHGTRHIAPMLNVTRTWNAVTAAAFMRRTVALARDYATKREAFGTALEHLPLHQETLADLQATTEGAFHLSFRLAELLGAHHAGTSTEADDALLRLLTPIAKLTTAKQAVAVTSEGLEAFGGAGYVEDTGLPTLLRDAQVLPIWEGTTNVLALDTLRAFDRLGDVQALQAEAARCCDALDAPRLQDAVRPATDALRQSLAWLRETQDDPAAVQAGARRFALTLGRALEVLLTAHHAQWALDAESDNRPALASERLARDPFRPPQSSDHAETERLARDLTAQPRGDRAASGDGAAAHASDISAPSAEH
jgi:alkylation response protein AidB-like acyl-CoA dehydrogenase